MAGPSIIERLRKQVQRNRYSANPLLKLSTLVLRAPWYFWQFASDGFYRSTIINRVFRPKDVHLTCNYTKMDRYPEIFGLVRDYFAQRDQAGLRLLSFGCSTGEEIFSLRRYFPQAELLGADISEWNLRQARKRNRDPDIRFIPSDGSSLRENGPYDAIFCMAVLLRIAHRMEPAPSSAEVYPIEKFEEQVHELDQVLQVGGLLIIQHSNYHLRDTALIERYELLPRRFQDVDRVPKYGRDNRLLAETDTHDRVFIKRG
jgi:Methyltransferase domain